ncbi:hypothetical protein ACFYW8_04190 [Streptomyces sp. NPDC002742]|uniref:hypothetical protein n=1 Tax=Streptomyces sp. NPDC002742 TaxID=3364663 RepID=UPI0036A4C3F9
MTTTYRAAGRAPSISSFAWAARKRDEGGVEAVDHLAKLGLGVLVLPDVTVAVDALETAEYGSVRAHRAVDGDTDRQADGDDEAVEA